MCDFGRGFECFPFSFQVWRSSDVFDDNNARGHTIWERPYVWPKIRLLKSDPYSKGKIWLKIGHYGSIFRNLLPFTRQKFLKFSNFVQKLPIFPKFYLYSALSKAWKTYPQGAHILNDHAQKSTFSKIHEKFPNKLWKPIMTRASLVFIGF